MNGYFRRVQKDRAIDKVLRVDNGLYFIRFQKTEDQEIVLQRECTQFDNKPVIVSAWTPDYEMDFAPQVKIWVRFLRLPIQYWGCSSLSKISSQLDTPVEMD